MIVKWKEGEKDREEMLGFQVWHQATSTGTELIPLYKVWKWMEKGNPEVKAIAERVNIKLDSQAAENVIQKNFAKMDERNILRNQDRIALGKIRERVKMGLLNEKGPSYTLTHVTSHTGVEGNEQADAVAAAAHKSGEGMGIVYWHDPNEYVIRPATKNMRIPEAIMGSVRDEKN
jgi:ribonuclease HI